MRLATRIASVIFNWFRQPRTHRANTKRSRRILQKLSGFAKRNKRYSGDGGIDGRVWIPGIGLFPVQCKRYSAHINPRDVFAALVKFWRGGIFVHTGRNGKLAYSKLEGKIVLLSGFDLAKIAIRRQNILGVFNTRAERYLR